MNLTATNKLCFHKIVALDFLQSQQLIRLILHKFLNNVSSRGNKKKIQLDGPATLARWAILFFEAFVSLHEF